METVNVEAPDPATDVGLRLAVTPAGRPRAVTLKSTVPLKPFTALTVIVLVPSLPCVTFSVLGDGASAKFGPVGTPPRAVSRLCPFGVPQPVTKS